MTEYGQRGVALSVWTAVAMPAFIIAVGLGVDFAGHAAAEQEARIVAGQAARAATHEIALTDNGPTLDAGAATRAASNYAEAAGYTANVQIGAANSADVTVRSTYPTLFLGMIGVHEMAVEGTGSARAFRTLNGQPG